MTPGQDHLAVQDIKKDKYTLQEGEPALQDLCLIAKNFLGNQPESLNKLPNQIHSFVASIKTFHLR